MQIRIKFWGKILIGIAILAASLYVGFAVVRTTTLHTWGSTYSDIQTTRPGDELVGQSLLRWDHAITINAPADQVWPWIAQLGDVRDGRRPSFIKAARPETAIPLYEAAIARLREKVQVETGEFGAYMDVELINDGPVTILLDSRKTF